MKKCPKCGTILDDSKKKCYMCGTELSTNKNPFGNGLTFDNDIGATVTKNQDNVFNNGEDIKFKSKDVVKKNDDNAFFSHNSSSKDYFGTEINKLNSMSYDERSGLQKGFDSIFGSDKTFKSKDDLQKKKDVKKSRIISENGEIATKITYSTKPKEVEPPKKEEVKEKKKPQPSQFFNNISKKDNKESKFDFGFTKKRDDSISTEQQQSNRDKFSFTNNQEKKNDVKKSKSEKNVNKPQAAVLDKFNDVKNNLAKKGKTKGYKNDSVKASGVDNKRMFINLICIVAFIGILVFIYFNFFKKDDVDMAGLTYTMDSEFKLSSKDNYSRYYTYGDSCAVRINYGPTSAGDTFVDNYLDNIKATYEKDERTTIQYEELNINDNIWTSMGVLYLPETTNSIGGVTPKIRYKYTAIVQNGNFYTIIFVNPKEEQTCYDKYNSFVDSLNFDVKE